jgi:hypothetical protein
MKTPRALLLLPLAAALGACTDSLVEPVPLEPSSAVVGMEVASEVDLQTALDAASAAPTLSTIRLAKGAVIALGSTLTHTGSAPLVIDGRGATLIGPDVGSAISSTQGADLTVTDLTVEAAAEHGIYVEVPGNRTGTVSVVLRGVTLRDNGFSGLWVDDQVYDSPASVSVRILRSVVSGNNTAGIGEDLDFDGILAAADKDGVRVNEGGFGDLRLFIQDSEFFENQADGVELDETGDGDVISQVLNSHFDDNGDQLQFPDEVPSGFPDDPDDYEKDLEDGFDIDENDEGSVWAQFVNVTANGNEDEGIDLDETYNGSIEMSGNNIVANDNFGAGIQLTESEDEPDTDGDIILDLSHVTANDSRDSRGIRIEEFQAGDVVGQIVQATFDNNDSDGVRIECIDDGAIDFRFTKVDFTNNGGDGLQVEENGTVVLVNTVFDNNDDDDINTDGVTIIERGK